MDSKKNLVLKDSLCQWLDGIVGQYGVAAPSEEFLKEFADDSCSEEGDETEAQGINECIGSLVDPNDSDMKDEVEIGGEEEDKSSAGEKKNSVRTATVVCQICESGVSKVELRRHVVRKHWSGQALYRCPYCDDQADNERKNLTQHMKNVHNCDWGAIQVQEEHFRDLMSLQKECFPNIRCPKPRKKRGSDVLSTSSEGVQENQINEEVVQDMQTNSDMHTNQGMQIHEDMHTNKPEPISLYRPKSALKITPSDSKPKSKRQAKFCNLCTTDRKFGLSRRAHAIGKHFSKPLYGCSDCDSQWKYKQMFSIHNSRRHDNSATMVTLEENDAELADVLRDCYRSGKRVHFGESSFVSDATSFASFCESLESGEESPFGSPLAHDSFFGSHSEFSPFTLPFGSLSDGGDSASDTASSTTTVNCALCSEQVDSRQQFLPHVKDNHYSGALYECADCGLGHKSAQDMNQHNLESHQGNAKVFTTEEKRRALNAAVNECFGAVSQNDRQAKRRR